MKEVSTASVCPKGFVEAHVNGSMSMTVLRAGSFDDPRIDGVGYVGYWKREGKQLNGSVNRYGCINLHGQDVTFGYREGKKGTKTFSLNPKRIFLDPSCFHSQDEAKELFVERAEFIASVLRNTGWELIEPVFNGNSTMEYAVQNSPLAQFIPQGHHDEDHDIIVDGSPGNPEAEMCDPDDWERVQIFADLPRHV